MKTTILAMIAALGVSAGAASADDFDNTAASITAEFGRFDFTLEGTQDDGYTELSLGATVLEYDLTDSLSGEVGVSVSHYDLLDAYGIGVNYTTTYTVDRFSVYGGSELEYVFPEGDFENGDLLTTPTLGAEYAASETVALWSEVSYTWVASDDWAALGGEFEVGADFGLADNVVFTPSVVRTFDTGADSTQLNLGLNFSF